LLADFQLLLIAPPVSDERRAVLRAGMLGPRATEVAMLELVPANGGEQLVQREGVVLWPCSAEELKRAIKSAMGTKE